MEIRTILFSCAPSSLPHHCVSEEEPEKPSDFASLGGSGFKEHFLEAVSYSCCLVQ